jgi:hypothetical protein
VEGSGMSKTINGTIHGRTIELAEDSGLQDGQEVRVQVTPLAPAAEPWGEGLRRCAGALADDPEWDAIMEEIHRARKLERRPLPDDERRTFWIPTLAPHTCGVPRDWLIALSNMWADWRSPA